MVTFQLSHASEKADGSKRVQLAYHPQKSAPRRALDDIKTRIEAGSVLTALQLSKVIMQVFIGLLLLVIETAELASLLVAHADDDVPSTDKTCHDSPPLKIMTPKSAKQKGKVLEDYVADRIVSLGLDPRARRDGASGAGNREKGDISTSLMILGQNAGIECKNQKSLAIPEWWRQTKKLESLGREPVLAFKQFGEPLEETKVVVYLETLLMLIKAVGDKPIPSSYSGPTAEERQLNYELDRLRTVIKSVQKYLG